MKKRTQRSSTDTVDALKPDEIAIIEAEAVQIVNISPPPHTPGKKPRVRRFRTVRDVTWELHRVYALARHGQMSWADASRAAYILRTAGDLLTVNDLEAQMAELEAAKGVGE